MVQFFIRSTRPRHHLLLLSVSLVIGLSGYNLRYFNQITPADLLFPSGMAFLFWALAAAGCYGSWMLSAWWASRRFSVPFDAALQEDIYAYLPLYLLMGTWLNHIGLPVGLFLLPALTGFLSLKCWTLRLRWRPAPWTLSRSAARYALAACVLAFAATFSALSILRYQAFRTFADFAVFVHQIWGFSRFEMVSLVGAGIAPFGNHFSPVLLLFAPFYWAWADPRVLLILYSAVMALGAVPIYLLALYRLHSPAAGVILGAVYLLYPAVQHPAAGDFHESLLIATPFLFAFLFLERGAYGKCLLCSLLTLMCKEDAGVLVGMLGAYIWWKKGQKRLGLGLMAGAFLWTAASIGFIMPYYQGVQGWYMRFFTDSSAGNAGAPVSMAGAALDLFSRKTLTFLLQLLIPVGGLALLAPAELLVGGPVFLELVLYNGPPFGLVGTIYTWHTIAVVPAFFIATLYGLETLRRRFGPQALAPGLLMIGLSGLFANVMYGVVPYTPRFDYADFTVTPHDRLGRALLKRIPDEASVTTTSQMSAHLAHRSDIYVFPVPWEKGNWRGREDRFPQTVEYVVADTSHAVLQEAQEETRTLLLRIIRETARDPAYTIVASEDGYVIFRRKEPPLP
jgi:uncharacterized membrane protein